MSWTLTTITSEEMEEVRTQIQHFRSCWDLVLRGDYYRLSNPFRAGGLQRLDACFPDKSRALVGVVMGVGHAKSHSSPAAAEGTGHRMRTIKSTAKCTAAIS